MEIGIIGYGVIAAAIVGTIFILSKVSASKRPCPHGHTMMPKKETQCPHCHKGIPLSY